MFGLSFVFYIGKTIDKMKGVVHNIGMKTFLKDTTLIQTSELRTRLDEALRLAKTGRVIIEKHHKPVAVLVDPERFEQMEEALEGLSDVVLALEARVREQGSKASDFVSLETVEKRLRK